MKFYLRPTKAYKQEVDTLNLFAFENEEQIVFRDFPAEIITDFKEAIKKENFNGKKGDSLVISGRGPVSFYKLILTGLGKKQEFDLVTLYDQIAKSIRLSLSNKAVKVALSVPAFFLDKYGSAVAVQATVEAVKLAGYKFLKYKGDEEKAKHRDVEEVILLLPAAKIAAAEEGIEAGLLFADAALYTRDLVNEPAQVTTPEFLAEEARKIAKNSQGAVKTTVLEEEEIKNRKMEAFMGVARGSHQPPRFILMHYKPLRPRKKIALLGKGITFDTGGLSLKGPEHMETMKLDMAGAAAVLGVFSVIAKIKPQAEIVGIIAACENMPGGRALKPGDILKAYNGKTIEVLNTDAEGRLTLADAMSYAALREKPDEMIDLATLTGACVVALGEDIAGLFGNNDRLLLNLEKSAAATADRVWRLPLEKSYQHLIKSHIADVKNISGGRYGGAITAALFLNEFTGEIPWVHLDIAGPAFAEKDTPLAPAGGTGYGVRLLLNYLKSV